LGWLLGQLGLFLLFVLHKGALGDIVWCIDFGVVKSWLDFGVGVLWLLLGEEVLEGLHWRMRENLKLIM
jgi:hypothetical protein